MTIDVSAFNAATAAGDKAMSSGLSTVAVQSYQQAGQLGATTLGPAIDTASDGASQSYTHQAWVINGTLAAINALDATASDAANAHGLVNQMLAQYKSAIATIPGPASVTVTGTSTGTSESPTLPLVIGAVGVLAGLALGVGLAPAAVLGAVGLGVGYMIQKGKAA
jgi:hypothetical protein